MVAALFQVPKSVFILYYVTDHCKLSGQKHLPYSPGGEQPAGVSAWELAWPESRCCPGCALSPSSPGHESAPKHIWVFWQNPAPYICRTEVPVSLAVRWGHFQPLRLIGLLITRLHPIFKPQQRPISSLHVEPLGPLLPAQCLH